MRCHLRLMADLNTDDQAALGLQTERLNLDPVVSLCYTGGGLVHESEEENI